MIDPSRLKIALQKSGRLSESSLDLLKSIGLEFDFGKDQLVARCTNFPLDILFLRDDDIPEYVQDGVCDLGVVGENMVLEKQAKVKAIKKLGFGRCRLSLSVAEESPIRYVQDLNMKRIATSYPNSLKKFLDDNKLEAQIIPIRGSVEIAPRLNLADAICDLVSTGNTLRQSGLKELITIFPSQSVLIQSESTNPDQQLLIDRLEMRIGGALQAKRSKYILMNAPATSLETIQSIIPALKSPTVLPLAEPGMIAIHSVIDEEVFWEVMEKLKQAGATGILVLPIEKMIL